MLSLDGSIRLLHVAPGNVRRVVSTALSMAGQPPLVDGPDGLIAPPQLRAGWERTVAGLADPLSGEPRPLTFDPVVSQDSEEVVLAHLEHRSSLRAPACCAAASGVAGSRCTG